MKENKILLVASRMNGEEFLLFVKTSEGFKSLDYKNMDQIRRGFSSISRILTDIPPKDIVLYTRCIRMMATLKPVVIEIPEDNMFQLIDANVAQRALFKFDSDSFLKSPLYYAKMKKSFVESRQILDLMEDMQSTLSVGADGTLGVNIISELKDENSIVSEEDLKNILRERGLL